MPGVESVALTTEVLQPLVTESNVFSIEGKPLPPPGERVEYPFEIVSPGFFETLRFQMVRGRSFTDQDHADAPRAVIINETLAKMGWPDQDPIGRRMRPGGEQSQAPWMTVVGVIRDARRSTSRERYGPNSTCARSSRRHEHRRSLSGVPLIQSRSSLPSGAKCSCWTRKCRFMKRGLCRISSRAR